MSARKQSGSKVIAWSRFLLSCINYNKSRLLCRQEKAPDTVKKYLASKRGGGKMLQDKIRLDILKLVQEALPEELVCKWDVFFHYLL